MYILCIVMYNIYTCNIKEEKQAAHPWSMSEHVFILNLNLLTPTYGQWNYLLVFC